MKKTRRTFISLLTLFVRNRRLFIWNFIVLCSLTALYSLACPKVYKSTTTILPPSDEGAFNLSSVLNKLPVNIGALGLGGVTGNANVYVAILNSRTIMETIAKQFDLQSRYQLDNLEDTIKALREQIEVVINDDGTISLTARASTPFLPNDSDVEQARSLATDIANSLIEEMGHTSLELNVEKAKNNRIFIERRYLTNVADLKTAEDKLTAFQKRTGTIAIPEQTKATIEMAAELNAQIMSKQVEASVLSRTVASDYPKLTLLENEINQLQAKFREVFVGKNVDSNSGKDDFEIFIKIQDMPDYAVEFARLYREIKLQEALMQFILPLYEQAKIEEAKDMPTVQVLDTAIRPIRRAAPKRTIMVLVAGFLSIVISSLIVISLDFFETLRNSGTEEYDQLLSVFDELRGRNTKDS